MSTSSTKSPATSAHGRTTTSRRAAPRSKHPSDDEILGIVTTVERPAAIAVGGPSFAGSAKGGNFAVDVARQGESPVGSGFSPDLAHSADNSASDSSAPPAISPELAQILEAHPELRDAVEAAHQFRAVFPTPAAAQDAKTQLDELDAMFFSAHPADHAALAAHIHELSPAAFHALAHALQAHAAKIAAAHANAAPKSAGAPSFTASVKGGNSVGSGFSPDYTPASVSSPTVQNSAYAVGPESAPVGADFIHRPAPLSNSGTNTNSGVVVGEGLQTLPRIDGSLSSEAEASPLQRPASSPTPAQNSLGGPSFAPALRQAAQREEVAKDENFSASPQPSALSAAPDSRRLAQLAVFHSANAAAVRQIVSAIESHVNRLLPDSVSAGTKTRIVGEIYRDLSATLGANRQLGKQLRDAFASASAGAGAPSAVVGSGFSHDLRNVDTQGGPSAPNAQNLHSGTPDEGRAYETVAGAPSFAPGLRQAAQRAEVAKGGNSAIVALLVGRAKQALPSIAKRVINEWTHGVVAANRERLARYESAAKRVDISGAASSDGVNRKPISPRDVDYARLSDSDILNL